MSGPSARPCSPGALSLSPPEVVGENHPSFTLPNPVRLCPAPEQRGWVSAPGAGKSQFTMRVDLLYPRGWPEPDWVQHPPVLQTAGVGVAKPGFWRLMGSLASGCAASGQLLSPAEMQL